MVQQLAHLAGGCGQSAESGLEIPRNFCQGEHSCQSGLLLTNPPQKNKGRAIKIKTESPELQTAVRDVVFDTNQPLPIPATQGISEYDALQRMA